MNKVLKNSMNIEVISSICTAQNSFVHQIFKEDKMYG